MEKNINDLHKIKAKYVDKSADKSSISIKCISREQRYAIPDYCTLVASSTTAGELNGIVNNLIKNSLDIEDQIEFDFLINSKFLETSIGEHIEKNEIFDAQIEVEYLKKHTPPEPKDCLMQDDWISAIAVCKKWILTGSYDNTLHIWDLKGKHQLMIPGHTRPLKSVAWISLDDEEAVFVSTSMENDCRIWNWNITKNLVNCISLCKGHKGSVDAVSVNQYRTLMVTGSWDKTLKIWSTCTADEDEHKKTTSKRARLNNISRIKNPTGTMKGHQHAISGIVWSDKTEIISSSLDHTIKIWDSELGGIKQEIHGENSFFAIDYSPLSRTVITGSADQYVKLYDPRSTGAITKNKFMSHKQSVSAVCWSTVNEHIFISGSHDSIVKMWDTRKHKAPLYDLMGHDDKVLCCNWSNSEWVLSGGADNSLRIFKSNASK